MTNQPQLPYVEPETPPADEQAHAAYRERLRQALQDPEFRATEGFPIGEDEAILALSDPPYYTACPNPFLPEIIARWQEERSQLRAELGLPNDAQDNGNGSAQYHREPFATDVSEGKNDAIYNAHSYHTKVPHKAIMRYILHYTDPGDVVFDGFCGTGMTGVAAQLCGDRKAVQSLGYRVDNKGAISANLPSPESTFGGPSEGGRGAGGEVFSRLGARKGVLVDLSPAATFIAYNYNTPVDVAAFEREAKRILREVEDECGWMYETWHPHCDHPQRVKGRINYTVWSDVFVCPQCGQEIVFWDAAVDKEASEVADTFPCPVCGAEGSKRTLERAWVTVFDRALHQTIRQAKQMPALINYSVGKESHEKEPDAEDLALIQKIEESDIPHWFPTDRMPEGEESRRNDEIGITHVHHFYTARNLRVMATISSKVQRNPLCLFGFLNTSWHGTVMRRFNARGGHRPLSGTLYIPSLPSEGNMLQVYAHKVAQLQRFVACRGNRPGASMMGTCSSTRLLVPDLSVDYAFVDPPFGGNLMYSELNFLWESWLKVFTNNSPEAIVNRVQGKALVEYQHLMELCFLEFHRVLKPGRWMTVEFHNSQNRVWNAIQEAILRAGFMVADVRILDKQQGSFKQYTSSAAVKQDLIISAYKPRASFERRFQTQAGTAEGAWAFVRQHLGQLPVVVEKDGALEVVAERQPYLLFDRMVAFHIQRGATVPLSAADFYAGLRERFVERDGMFFLPDQVPAYDRARLQARKVAQLALFVSDEKSAVQWLRQQLDPSTGGHAQTYAELQPQFLSQLHQARHEALPELSEVLQQNFLQDQAGSWYVPDANRASDLEKLRCKALLHEFAAYAQERGRLKQFRTEAVRAGFADAWHRRDYATIVKVADRLPEAVLQEDQDLLMYYDNATLRL